MYKSSVNLHGNDQALKRCKALSFLPREDVRSQHDKAPGKTVSAIEKTGKCNALLLDFTEEADIFARPVKAVFALG